MTGAPKRIWAWFSMHEKQDDMIRGGRTAYADLRETGYACADLAAAERDHILAIIDAHPNGSPGWLAMQIREGWL